MNHTETRLAVLDRLYQLHRELTRTMDHCCQRECNVCCTCNVTLTTLEGEYLPEGRTVTLRGIVL